MSVQDSSAKEPVDLKVKLRSSTGSNRFKLGEVIPLEVLISSNKQIVTVSHARYFGRAFGYTPHRQSGVQFAP
jgi:hypothetical protein